ncbi:SurA N-terminal domain-containing protein [Marinomonas sp. C2222]|uniref:Periplasmic chaperone PpiD n=1 Tax=Marinomonas sargassi TaxID=2984494 RepID=A0ABT2YQM0_9GAMM|nr:SurA N-terminal domain-containing protein [Marinomonas sargassi]MCV2402183.1 SurA N-terminal domain-containing protein [Marinomonas sargassi]
MLQDIRDKSQGIVVKIIVGFIVVTFALFGVEALVASFTSSDTVAEVDGIEITRTEVLQGAETQRRQLISAMGGQLRPELLEDNLLQRRALDDLIQRAVLEGQAEKLGLSVSDSQVDAFLVEAEQFQTNGVFDQDRYLNFIRSLGFTPLAFKERIKQDVLIQQSRNAVAGSEFVLPYQIEGVAALQSQERSYDYVTFSLADESEVTSVTDEELMAYYEENKDNFKQSEQVKVDYVVISSSDFENKISVSDAELQDAYQASISGFLKEERAASHILIDTSDRTDEQAQAILAEVQAKLDSGESFESLAQQYSDDIGSKDAGGSIGFFEKLEGDAFNDALFSMAQGEFKSVQGQFGLHLIRLDEIAKAEAPSFGAQEAELREELVAEKAKAALLQAHEDITDLAYASDELQTLATEYGVDVLQSDYFGREGGSDDVTSNPVVVAAAFDVSVLEDNQNSSLIELSDEQVVVLHLNNYKAAAVQAFEETKDQIASIVVQNKALVALNEKAEAAKNAQDTEWQEVANAKRGQDEVSELAFTLPHPTEGAVLDVKGLANGDLALIRLNDVVSVDGAVEESEKLAYGQYLSQVQSRLSAQGQQDLLQNSAEIER